ncbi:MAG: XRE family transcriptional regulator, partial [Chitinophagaceae bacterium]
MKELSKHDLGNRITELRKLKGFYQEDLANAIAISRPSLAQVELGNRNVDVFEMKKITEVLGCSMDEIISYNFSILEEPPMEYSVKKSV